MKAVRPVIAVSACLLGENVRYDGGNRRDETVLSLTTEFDLRPFCPEVGIGLGVPRPTLQLVREEDGVHVLGVEDRSRDVTTALKNYAGEMAGQWTDVRAVIFKCRSPSCGLDTTPLHDVAGQVIGVTSGAFAAEIAQRFPNLPLTDEEMLCGLQSRKLFLQHVMRCHQAGR